MPRIGLDARLTYYRQGGIAQYTYHLIRELAVLDGESDYLIIHSRKDRRNLAAASNQRRVTCWTPAHHRIERLALALELFPLRLNLLHSPDFIPPLDGRWRSVITIHDLAFLLYPDILTADSRRYYNDQIKAAVARADHIIAVSEATRNDVIAMLDVPPEKVTAIPEAAAECYQPAPPEEIARVRQAHQLPGDYILFVGTYEPRKNLGGLLRAYDHLRADLRDAPPLVVAGRRGWLDDPLFTLAERLGLAKRVIWLEDPPDSDLPALYSGARVLCMPSFYEGFGLPILEAMACGTPVVAAERGSLPEVVGEAGLLVDPNDPANIAAGLRRVLTDSGLAGQLRQRGLEWAARFTWKSTARQTLAIYHELLSGSL